MAFGEGRYGTAPAAVAAAAGAQGFGGSQAQRNLIFLTAMEAARRAGDTALCEGLRSEAAARRPAVPSASARFREAVLEAA